MARWEQYEVWARAGERWEMLGCFRDFDVANAVVHARRTGIRLVRAVYADGQPVEREVLAEIGSGATREHP